MAMAVFCSLSTLGTPRIIALSARVRVLPAILEEFASVAYSTTDIAQLA